MNTERLATVAIAALAAARLTRFFTSDKLGEWLFVGPAKRWALLVEGREAEIIAGERALRDGDAVPTPLPQRGWRSKLVSGLDCSFCVGFWAGALVLLTLPLRRVPVLGAVVHFGLSALALNYVAGHISSRLDG